MKRFLSLFIVLTLVFGACSLTACDLIDKLFKKTTTTDKPGPPNSLAFELINGDSYSVAGIGKCTGVALEIPREYEGKPVTAIKDEAFLQNDEITSVIIPNTVISIGDEAFAKCTSLTTVEYKGTMEEWDAVSKGERWCEECPAENVICTDGQVCLHKFGEWETVKDATFSETGLEKRTCSLCTVAEEREIPIIKQTITIWVSTTWGMKELTEEQIAKFMADHPEYNTKYNVKVEIVGEADAAYGIITGVYKAPDLYFFTQDYLPLLVQSGALASLDEEKANAVALNHDAGALNAATLNGTVYAYPLTSDNGFYLYYDSRYISDEEAKTLEGIIAACERSDKKFGYDFSTGWYALGFFFSQPVGSNVPLCVSQWTFSADSKAPVSVNDTFNSTNGLIAMRGMQKITQSSAWLDSSYDFSSTAAVVSGIRYAYTAEQAYGSNLKATKLPTFTVGENTYQLGSYSGYKFLGVNPEAEGEKSVLLHELAAYLSSEECQSERYLNFQWGPSNLNAQKSPEVIANQYLSALLEQNVYSQPQGIVPDSWWTDATTLCMSTKNASDDDLRAALETYEESIKNLVEK